MAPSTDAAKLNFLAELHELRVLVRSGPRLLCGDFNMIYRVVDKDNNRLNRRLMGRFRHFLNDSVLKEVHLTGHLFTWSNERTHLTLEKIDRALISNEWEELFPANDLHSLSSLCSDHASLLLGTDASFSVKKRFHFRSFWPHCLTFMQIVEQAWNCPLRDAKPFRRLDWLFRNTMNS
jgi:endonuclease/exonuclease/phosphatase family metal-dependent hydrolase